MRVPELYLRYIELLEVALEAAERYQDWSDLSGRSRYLASDEKRQLDKFLEENKGSLS